MRPLRLDIEGFTAFRTPTCLNLAELDLFAITGPTGAGKSSLIDAICYALYGAVPRVTDEITSCISQGLDRMKVTLEFKTGEECYRVFRETRRKGAPNVRLDRQGGPDDWRTVAEGAREVTARVIDTIGLDYNGFTRSVLLPQGQFQEFIAGSADKRRAVLRSLLSFDVYERMRGRAGAIASELNVRMTERERELQGLADATPENLKALEQTLTSRRLEATRLEAEAKALSQGVELASTVWQARGRVEAAETEAASTVGELKATQSLVAGGEGDVEALTSALEAAEARLASNCFDPDRFNALTLGRERAKALQDCLEAMTKAQQQQEQAGSQLTALAAAAQQAEQKHAASEAELQAAEDVRRDAELHNLAAALQQGLKPGDPCPVCGGIVGEIVPLSANGLEATVKRCDAARKAELTARETAKLAVARATSATATAQTASERLQQLSDQRLQLAASLDEALPDEEDVSMAGIVWALNQQVEARTERRALEAQVKDIAVKLDRLTSDMSQARQKLAVLAQRRDAAERALETAQGALSETCGRLIALAAECAWQDVAAAVEAGRDVSQGLRTHQASTQAEHQQTLQIIGQSEERLTRLRADMARAKGLHKELEGLKKEHGVAADLALMLQANKFQDFMQSEALQTLAQDGSRRLEELSTGRYRLRVEDRGRDFEVIDQWNADQPRSVKTLSGGETFLASLALALALAESLPGLAASRRVVLDSIFLDEGFGSLDAEALDRAADALDRLRDENRLVCVVTHLPELAQRLPARVVVTKSETGSSVAVD